MTIRSLPLLLAFCLTANAQTKAPIDPAKNGSKVKVVCIGDSITQGIGADKGKAWPDQLQEMLGKDWEVRNYGSSGKTLMNSGDRPYQGKNLKNPLKYLPDVAIIMLGTNDTKPQNWTHFEADYEKDYRGLIDRFQKLGSKPRIFLCLPPYCGKDDKSSINNPNIKAQIPVIHKLAKELSLEVIDVYSALEGKDKLIPDKVHPNSEGAKCIAQAVFASLVPKN